MADAFSKVMLTLDGSGFARQAAPQAAAIATRFNSTFILYTVLDNPRRAMTLPLLESDIELLEAGIERHSQLAAEKARRNFRALADDLGVPADKVEVVVEMHHNPAEAIAHYAAANSVDLIVMCTHGRGGLDRRLHGSVAESVLRHAPCPILLVRADSNPPE